MTLFFQSKGYADKDWVGTPARLNDGPNQLEDALKHIRNYLEIMLKPGGSTCVHTFRVSIDPTELNPNYIRDLEAAGYEVRNNKIKRIQNRIARVEAS